MNEGGTVQLQTILRIWVVSISSVSRVSVCGTGRPRFIFRQGHNIPSLLALEPIKPAVHGREVLSLYR
jgi:hypothetical protein